MKYYDDEQTAEELAEEAARRDEHRRQSVERVDRLVSMLVSLYGLRRLYGTRFIVEFKNEAYTITDNGGEWNIDKINHPNPDFFSVAYTAYRSELDTATQAQRVINYLHGLPIDYNVTTDKDNALFCELSGIPERPSWQQQSTKAKQ